MPWTWDAVWKVLQPQSKHSGMVCTLALGRISAHLSKSWEACVGGGINVIVKPYAHSQPEKVLKHLIYVWHGHGMQFERFYRLNQSIVAWTLASGRISANFPKSGEASVVVMVWVWSYMPIHNLRKHSNTSCTCMTWTWDAVWKVLQPQS